MNELSLSTGMLVLYKAFKELLGYVEEYPTMHYFGISREAQTMMGIKILTGLFGQKLHCGNVVSMPYHLLACYSMMLISQKNYNYLLYECHA